MYLAECLTRYIGQTVTIFTQSGGNSGDIDIITLKKII